MAQRDKPEERALAQAYEDAAKDDAWHERASGDPADKGQDPTLTVTPEEQDRPMSDVAHPDPVDSEDRSAPPSDKGPDYDALMRGFEPGETSMG